MSKTQRPPSIAVQGGQSADEDATLGERQSSLLPGQVRTPSYIVTLADWAAPGSSVWDEDVTPGAASEPRRTPLAGYVSEGDVWVTEEDTVAPGAGAAAAGADGMDPANVAHEALAAVRERLHESPTTAQTEELPAQPPAQPPRPQMPRSESEYWGFSTNPNQQRGSPIAASPGTAPERAGGFTFRVSDGSEASAATGQPTGTYTASATRGGRPPTLDDERVAHSIIASAGLPLSVTSLRSYIKDGQPHLEQTAAHTTGHRNFPNLTEPAAEEVNAMPGGGVGGGGYHPAGAPAMGGMGMPRQGGGWTVEVDPTAAAAGSYRGSFQGNAGYGGHVGGMGGPHGAYRSGAPPAGFVTGPQNPNPAGTRRFQQPTYANIVSGNLPHNDMNNHHNGGNFGAALPSGAGGSGRGAGNGGAAAGPRTKSESEILSDLLHFHANFFPPPPPPFVPVEERRRRAELWYHYASKWDITHRLPPPPRSPLVEMEMEYRMKLPEKTRVPYHGDDWLRQCDLWFRVVQNLFDYPEENIAVEVDLNTILENAVLS